MHPDDRQFLIEQFSRISERLDGHSEQFLNIADEFKLVHGGLARLEARMDNRFSDLSDLLEREMAFTSDFRDEFDRRITTLEKKLV